MKKVLIITYYWPPAGGPGVQRWLKFVKYLPSFNIKPIVFVPENPTYPTVDESLIKEVSEEIEVIKLPIKEPYKMASKVSTGQSDSISKGIIPSEKKQSLIQKAMLFVRGNFFIPDARRAWVKPSVNYLSEYLVKNDISTVITTGPPHSLHLIGLELKIKSSIRWIADFRDPWTTIGYHNKLKLLPWARSKHKKLESAVLNQADQVIVTSHITSNEFKAITDTPIEVITNGYDDVSIDPVKLDKRFSVSHIGTLLTERNPDLLWEILSELTIEDNTFKSLLQINLIGSVGVEVLQVLEQYDLSRFLNLKGYVDHDSAVRYQRQSQVLLLLEIDSEETKCIIPGKLFEYMASGRPILALGPEGSDVQEIISKTNTGKYFNYSQKELIKETIMSYFHSFRKNELESHGIGIKPYHRKDLTKKLADIILS
ncbi:MAG: glycosyltransferase family 4 protein [Flavobacteriaceae bacterium]|nr:glycosyltransferase family 4 protein [Flavobacteriaceae bacterium]